MSKPELPDGYHWVDKKSWFESRPYESCPHCGAEQFTRIYQPEQTPTRELKLQVCESCGVVENVDYGGDDE